jgi:hypothetical protein
LSKNSLNRLKDILEEELKLYNEDFSYVEKRLEFINNKKMNELHEMIAKEKFLGEKLKTLEIERVKLTKSYGVNTLNELILTLDKNEQNDFLFIREKLINVLENIKNKNILCENLIDISTQMINTIIEEASGKKDVGYNQFKQKSSIINNNLLNTRG